jgi:hypothetical protein
VTVRKELEDVELSSLGEDEVKAIFDAAKKKVLQSFGRIVREKSDLPQGVRKTPWGKFASSVWWYDKERHIGMFDTVDQASAACLSVRKDLDDAKLLARGSDGINAAFNAARKKALKSFGGFVLEKKDQLPRGVFKNTSSGKFQSQTRWGGKKRYIGMFDTPEQASAAYFSVRKDLDDAKLSTLGSDEVDAIFDAAKQKSLESFGGFVPEKRDLPLGVRKARRSKKFESVIKWRGKDRYVGAFDTPEQASAAYVSVRKDRDDAKLSPFGSDKVDGIFDAAKKKALDTVKAMTDSDECDGECLVPV